MRTMRHYRNGNQFFNTWQTSNYMYDSVTNKVFKHTRYRRWKEIRTYSWMGYDLEDLVFYIVRDVWPKEPRRRKE